MYSSQVASVTAPIVVTCGVPIMTKVFVTVKPATCGCPKSEFEREAPGQLQNRIGGTVRVRLYRQSRIADLVKGTPRGTSSVCFIASSTSNGA